MRSREKRVADSGNGVRRGERISGYANGDYAGGAYAVAADRKEKLNRERIAKQRRAEIMEAMSSPEKTAAQKAKNEEVKDRLRKEFAIAKFTKETPDYESMDEMMQDYVPVDRELANAVTRVRLKEKYREKNR